MFENDCRPHIEYDNCAKYDPVVKDKCLECDLNYLLFQQSSFCIKGSSIDNCEIYESENQCLKCL